LDGEDEVHEARLQAGRLPLRRRRRQVSPPSAHRFLRPFFFFQSSAPPRARPAFFPFAASERCNQR
jgi:hypothetical protein